MTRGPTDVLIIGAGVAGLACARRLSMSAVPATIVEARDRIGGRVHTLHEGDWPVPLEAGAEFVHGDSPAVEEAGLATYEVENLHWHSPKGAPQPLDFDGMWERIADHFGGLTGEDLPFTEFLRDCCSKLSHLDRAHATAYAEGFNAADTCRLSTRWLARSEAAVGQGAGAPFRIRDGYDRLAEWLRAGADVRLNTVVTGIRWEPGRVEVETKTGEAFRSAAAVVTLPLGVLQVPAGAPGAVRFDPDPPGKREAWSALAMGAVVKLLLRFRRPFWAGEGVPELAFLHTPGGPFQAWWTTRPVKSTVLTGWSGGPPADHLTGLDSNSVLDLAIDQLAKSFSVEGDRLRESVEEWRLFEWQSDSFTCGAYSYVPTGALPQVKELAKPVVGTLFFAGEATDERRTGTVAGAIASGERAADEVLSALGSG